MAADLHLLIATTGVHQLAITPPIPQIPGAIETGSRRSVRMRYKALGAQARPAVITPRQARARQINLSQNPARTGLQVVIQHPGADAPIGQPDPLIGDTGPGGHGADGGLRGAVFVE